MEPYATRRDVLLTSLLAALPLNLTSAAATPPISSTSCPDSEERTGIWFETERVYGYSGGEGAARQTLSPGERADPGLASVRAWFG
jgi:hypothetical protein